MSQRAIIGLQPGADWAGIKQRLVAAGAESIRDPSPSQPDVLVATIPDARAMDAFLQSARTMPGVRYAEPDAWRTSL